ncbi:MAG: putative cell-wall-anchored protein SasA motif, partial [Candidatus Solibacter sp.]|nr:putative cell-wall-anchored protein SasA motif [Candidatus Solibacter sp.]
EFTSATPVFTATASLTAIPFDQDLEPQDESTPVLSLQVFATDFEQAFTGFKLATGADQDYRGDAQRAACGQAAAMLDAAPADSSNDDNNKQLWAVNFGTNGPANARFNYNVQQGVQFYALPPLSTKLWDSNGDLTLQTYKTGTGLSGTKTLQFHSIDVDGWASGFLADMDKFLSPAFAAPIYAVDPANFTAVVRAKGDLADSIKQDLAVVLNNSATGNLGDAQQALYQQLLVELSSAYSVDTIVQYPFQISSPCSDAKVACRLSGKPLANTYSTPGTGTVNLSDVANALSVSVPYLAYVLQQMQFILNVNIQVTYGTGQPSYTVQNGDTLGTIAAFFKVDVKTLAATLQVLTAGQGLFRLSTVIGVTSIKHPLVTGDTFAAIASRYGTTVQTLLLANQTLANVFVPNSTVTLNGVSNPAPASGRPDDTAALFKLSIDDFGAALWSGDLNATAKYSLSTNGAVLMTLLVQPPVYSFTTGKVPLANGTGYGTYLFSVQDPELSRSVFLNLDYAITDMEYDILDVPNTGGYQSSSWLSFINPIQSAPTAALPNDGRFGLVEIPVPLRAYPSPYVVSQQAALAQNDTAALQDSSIFDWKYQFQIARQAAAQDSSTLTVILNAAGDAPPMRDQSASDRTALFQALAQYAFVSAALNSDLDLIQLAQPTPAQQAAAAAAIAAFATLAGKIRDHWKPIAKLALGSGITGDIYDFDLNTLVSAVTTGQFAYLQLSYDDGPADFLFTIGTQYATDLTSDNVSAVQPLFANAGYPLSNDAEISGTSSGPWTIVDDANLATYTAVLVAGSAITINRKYLWPTIYDASGEQPVQLKAEQLQSTMLYTYNHDISLPMALQFDFERLNIINKQNAWGGASVSRNAFLVEGRPTMDNFVYRAPEIYFPNKVTPRLVITEPINLRDQPGQPNDLPTALNTFLTGLFAAQANAQPHSIRQISASARYNFAVAKMASAATAGAGKKGSQAAPQITAGFPLTLVSQYNFDVTTDPAAFSAAFAAQIAIAAAQAGAPTNAGSYSCTLTVFSASSNSAGLNPTVQYENLYFDLEV